MKSVFQRVFSKVAAPVFAALMASGCVGMQYGTPGPNTLMTDKEGMKHETIKNGRETNKKVSVDQDANEIKENRTLASMGDCGRYFVQVGAQNADGGVGEYIKVRSELRKASADVGAKEIAMEPFEGKPDPRGCEKAYRLAPKR